jgi:hypothetical protein
MTREQKRAVFDHLATHENITTGRQFALEYTESDEQTKRLPIVGPAKLLIEHPFRDAGWMVARKLPEPQFYLLCTIEGQTAALHESQFERLP